MFTCCGIFDSIKLGYRTPSKVDEMKSDCGIMRYQFKILYRSLEVKSLSHFYSIFAAQHELSMRGC